MKSKTLFTFLVGAVVVCSSCSTKPEPGVYEIADWKDFTRAAVSYTFDDHCPNQFAIAVPLFDQYDFKLTLYPVPAWGPNWDDIRRAVANGHEVGSHTVSHPVLGRLTVEEQIKQYTESISILHSELGVTNENGMTIAYPNCAVGDVKTISQYFIAGRICSGRIVAKTPADFYNISAINCGSLGVNDLPAFQEKLAMATAENGWLVLMMHGIDDNSYSPVTAEFLRESVEYMDKVREDFWVASFKEVVLYIKERDAATIKEVSLSSTQITLEVTDGLDDAIYQYPLTIRRQLPAKWEKADVTQNGKAVSSKRVEIDGQTYIQFEAVPDGGIVSITK
ncbi:peptidoglycan/xylan/chitin deacetylase (PgdA/CDA1 family) [Parabacteroides sp. PFB2-12]|uniref:polysaccharide deacetylase family protein n=1 Tax=unclassified Parabacteroides TaxID=2649774 RepID=UPI0024737C73|nr:MULTISPECIES: polysaccharide deacetylase family protein [unclassified Parabacteroides]MDH6343041.1 peptidoglycan/xylan/chitin deacetylase (PgdA/CDA1 family) [Parabacteroides sp. PM6-13]MDH6390446.1 peptidoglycan/xylan/chitin deacetylase (PgdA/CDA1 family) [Parabacteroides sp. PFB2-12]